MMRFDMRSPLGSSPNPDLYDAAIEMCEWAEGRGCVAAVLCEHHGSDDGYLPSPLTLASAIAARTKSLPVMIAALILPFYEPVRLAEEMVVLDIISRGRVSYVLALGYRLEEYEHFGLDMAKRGRIADEKLSLLMQLLGGKEVVHDGRRIHVTPASYTPGGPAIMWGGGSLAAARRAGRFGLGLLAQSNLPGMQEAYEAACRSHGHEPGFTLLPERDTPTASFVARDVDEAWQELGPYLLRDARAYSAWNPDNDSSAGISRASTVDELRAGSTYKIFSMEEAAEQVHRGGVIQLSPLCGGIPPGVAWHYLDRVADVLEMSL